MNKINKDEMFGNLKQFLKSKGIELQNGTYAERIRQGCGVLADSVNLSQDALKRTKAAMNKGLEQLREVIHEQTAPKPAGKAQTGKASNRKGKARKPSPAKTSRPRGKRK
jgi:hypothetical protein